MKGVALRLTTHFTVVPRAEIRKRNIKIYRTEESVWDGDEVKPLYANLSWDDDEKVEELFELTGVDKLVDDCIVDSEARLDFFIAQASMGVL